MRYLNYFICLLLLIFAEPAFAWNSMGHRIIAEIAYQHLDDKAKARSMALISYMADAYPYSSNFQTAATWADTIREDGVHVFDSWHFINQPIFFNFNPDQQGHSSDCAPARDNIVFILNQAMGILNNPRSNQFEKALFLRFVLHLTGDIHQPLHAASRFSPEFPQGDHGGNLFLLPGSNTFNNFNNFNNLHSAWDAGLGLFNQPCGVDFGKKYHRSKSSQAKCWAEKIQQDYPESYFGAKIDQLNPEIWAHESFQIAQNFAYTAQAGQPLSAAYIQQGQQITGQQLALAGYRLAHVLNQLFG